MRHAPTQCRCAGDERAGYSGTQVHRHHPGLRPAVRRHAGRRLLSGDERSGKAIGVDQPLQAERSLGELIALVDSLHSGAQPKPAAVQVIRDGILALARKEQLEDAMEDVKVQMIAR